MKARATAAEKAHMGRVASLPCVCCHLLDSKQEGPTYVHHIRTGQGMSQRASHWLTVALCYACHQGPNGVHGDQTFMAIGKLTELDLLAETIRLLTLAERS
jgi:hypothetical protein